MPCRKGNVLKADIIRGIWTVSQEGTKGDTGVKASDGSARVRVNTRKGLAASA